MHFPPFFHTFSIIFSPQHVIWPYFRPGMGEGGQTEKYKPLPIIKIILIANNLLQRQISLHLCFRLQNNFPCFVLKVLKILLNI